MSTLYLHQNGGNDLSAFFVVTYLMKGGKKVLLAQKKSLLRTFTIIPIDTTALSFKDLSTFNSLMDNSILKRELKRELKRKLKSELN